MFKRLAKEIFIYLSIIGKNLFIFLLTVIFSFSMIPLVFVDFKAKVCMMV